MKINRSIALICFACLTLLSACASNQQQAGVVLTDSAFAKGGWQARPAVIENEKGPGALYLDSAGAVKYQTAKTSVTLPGTETDSSWQFFGLHQHDKELYASWWSHMPKKAIYVSVSNDDGKTFPAAQVANGEHAEPLYPFSLFVPKSDAPPSVIYLDERKNQYHVYINHYDPAAKAWSKTDEQLDVGPLATNPSGVPAKGEFPSVFHHDNSVVVTWLASVYTEKGRVYRLLSRQSNDGGMHWQPTTLVVENDQPISPAVGSFVDGKFALVTMIVGKGLVTAVETDKAQGWDVSEPLPSSDLNINSGMQLASGTGAYKDKLFIVWSAQKQTTKPMVMAAVYNVKDRKWQGNQIRLDTEKTDQTESILPVISSDVKGVVLAAWIDFRNILPNIYVSGSQDGGETWTDPQNVQVNGMESGMTPVLIPAENKFNLAYQVDPNLLEKKRLMIIRQIEPISKTAFGPFPESKKYTAEEMKAQLETRDKEFWKFRLEGNADKVWGYYDPVYKAFVPKEPFTHLQKDFRYFNYKVLDTKIDGKIAKIKVETTFEIPGTEVFGHAIKESKRTATIEETWLWIGDNWYQQFNNPVTGSYIHY